METIIVYVDDPQYAQPLLEAASQAPNAAATHWVIVACAPKITHRVSKFVSNRARENWRSKWAERLFAACVPALERSGARVTTQLACAPLPEVLRGLQQQCGDQAQLVDLRRPKQGAEAAEVVPTRGWVQQIACLFTGASTVWTMCLTDALAG